MTKRIKNTLIVVAFFITLISMLSLTVFSARATSNISLAVNDVALRTESNSLGEYGIRYTATVDGYNSNATYGMYIVPEDLKDDTSEYKEAFGVPTEEDGTYTYTCALTDVLPSNTSRPFVAKAFARVDGQDVATSEWSTAKSIYTIATQALADTGYDKEGVSEYLTGVVDTVHGVESSLNGKYVIDAIKVGDENVEDINAFDFNKEFTLSATVVKEGDTSKNLTAYPIVTATNGSEDVTASVLSQIDAYGQYKFVDNKICDFTLDFSFGSTKQTVESCNLDSYNATYNQDGSVSLSGRQVGGRFNGKVINDSTYTDGTYVWTNVNDLGYLALEGEYGVGTYIDIYFTGNNMPYIMFFADEINGNVGPDGGEGVILFNGVVYDDSKLSDGSEAGYLRGGQMIVYGPNRMDSRDYSGQGDMDMFVKGMDSGSIVDADVYKMTQIGLRQNSDTNYKFTVGTYEDANGLLALDLVLIDADTRIIIHKTSITYASTRSESYKIPVSSLTAGNIILYSSLKASSSSSDRFTTFKVSEPYVPATDTVTRNAKIAGGGVTITAGGNSSNGTLSDDAWHSTISKAFPNNYIGFNGGYEVGDYIDFIFTGNNMPIVTLFAGEVTHAMGGCQPDCSQTGAADDHTDKQTGYLISNGGFYISNSSFTGLLLTEHYYVFGPNRIDKTLYNNYTTVNSEINKYNTNVGCATLDDNTEYKYTVGSKLEEGTVVIVFELYKLEDTTYTEVFKGTYQTGKTESEAEALGDNVIAYAGVKGSSLATTFAYSEIYTKD